jgi:HAE1 family hydrophobic/amphiphilic exporter-1
VIVGGLIVSQFLTLYITPVIYLYLEQFQEKVLDRVPMFHSGHQDIPVEEKPQKEEEQRRGVLNL